MTLRMEWFSKRPFNLLSCNVNVNANWRLKQKISMCIKWWLFGAILLVVWTVQLIGDFGITQMNSSSCNWQDLKRTIKTKTQFYLPCTCGWQCHLFQCQGLAAIEKSENAKCQMYKMFGFLQRYHFCSLANGARDTKNYLSCCCSC